MADRTLTVKIIGDERDLLRAFQRSTRATQRFSVTAGSVLKGAFIFEGVRAGINALQSAVRAGAGEFSQMQQVAAQTGAVLKSTGGIANVTALDVDKLATRLSRLSGVDDEAIASAENLILTFKNVRNELGKGNAIFDRTALAALDLSKAAGGAFGSLYSSAKQLAKALNDPVRGMTALGRAGVTFSESQKDTIKALVENNDLLAAQKLILREVESQVGGSARAFGETLPGQLSKLREAFRNAFGNLVAVVATPLAQALGSFAEFIPKIEQGVERISSAVGPALSELVSSFVDRLPELQRIASSVLEPLREHVLPVLRDVLGAVRGFWNEIVSVFDDNSGSLRNILQNLGETLAAVWTVARPTIVFLFQTVLPTALRVSIPIIEALSEGVRFLAQIFTRSVSAIVQALDKFLGGLSELADAASHIPFLGDHFAGVSDKINAARERLREFSAELDALNNKRVKVAVELPGERAEGAAGRRRFEQQPEKQTETATKVIERRRVGAVKVQKAAAVATVVTKAAKTAAEKQREVFDELLDVLNLRSDRAEATRGLQDDLKVLNDTEQALLEQVKVEGRTVELQRQLFELRQERLAIQKDQRQRGQFKALGLTDEGDERTPGAGSLRKRLGNLRDQIKGTALDTEKTRSQLQRIAKVLSGQFGAVGKDVRSAILQMFNDISAALNEGSDKVSAASGPLTKTSSLNSKKILAGMGLSPEEIRELRGRLSNFNSSGVGLAGAQTSGTTGGFAGGAGFVVENYVTVQVGNEKLSAVVTREQQKTKRRNPQQKRGPNRIGGV